MNSQRDLEPSKETIGPSVGHGAGYLHQKMRDSELIASENKYKRRTINPQRRCRKRIYVTFDICCGKDKDEEVICYKMLLPKYDLHDPNDFTL